MQPPHVPGTIRRALILIGDACAIVGIVLGFPLVILAIGTPIALAVRLLLWILGIQ